MSSISLTYHTQILGNVIPIEMDEEINTINDNYTFLFINLASHPIKLRSQLSYYICSRQLYEIG